MFFFLETGDETTQPCWIVQYWHDLFWRMDGTANWAALLMNLQLITARLGQSPEREGMHERLRFIFWRCCIESSILWTSPLGRAIFGSTLGCYTTREEPRICRATSRIAFCLSSNSTSFCAWLCQDEKSD